MAMKAPKDPLALKRELWGWYVYDFANSAFFNSAATVFIPLLVNGLATKYAWDQKKGADRPEQCADLKEDNVTQTNCVKCIQGYGDRLITLDPITGLSSQSDLEVLKLPGGINPTSFVFTMISISVLFQAIVFISVGSLGDYGNFRRRGLITASTVGSLACCCYIFVPLHASLYWLGGLILIISNVSLGVSVVFYNSYLPLMVDDSPEVVEAKAAAALGLKTAEDVCAAQERAGSEFSSKGMMWGYVGGTVCIIASFIVVTVCSFLGMGGYWALAVGASLSGVWWFAFSLYAFARIPDRPGLPIPPGANLMYEGWVRIYRLLCYVVKYQPATGWFLALFFIFSDGYATIATVSVLFASRELCLGITPLIMLSVMVPLFAVVGGWLWFKFQVFSNWSTKAILVTNLFFLGWLPMWGCVGFFTTEFGLRKPVELYVLAVWFGLCLGSAQAYGRALFSELIPAGHEADMFALFEITDKGSSWLGPLVASVILQLTGKIRPVLIYLLAAMVLPALFLHMLDLSDSIKSARAGTGLERLKGHNAQRGAPAAEALGSQGEGSGLEKEDVSLVDSRR